MMGKDGQLRLILDPDDWKAVKRIAKLRLTPEDGLAILNGDEEA